MKPQRDARFDLLFQTVSIRLFDRFWEFHENHPRIYEAFLRFTFEAAETRVHYSHWAIAQRVRWHFEITIDPREDFKLQNDFIACYARLMVWYEPRLEGFFTFRRCNPNRKVQGKGTVVRAPVQPQGLI